MCVHPTYFDLATPLVNCMGKLVRCGLSVQVHGVYKYSLTNFQEISRRYPRYIFKKIPEDFYATSHSLVWFE